MKFVVPRRPIRLRRVGAVAVAAVCALALAAPAAAYPGCSAGTPAVSTPQQLWGGLQPAAPAPFADTTVFNGNQLPNDRYPLWSALDVEGDVLFATYTEGFAIFDVSDPAHVTRDVIYDCRSSAYPRPVLGHSEERDFFNDVDAPAGRTDVAVAGGRPSVGLVIWKVQGTAATAIYQDSGQAENGKSVEAVFAATIGGKAWAFAAATGYRPGLHYYDASAAIARTTPCGENADAAIQCPGIYKGRIGPVKAYVHLGSVAKGDGTFLVGATGGYTGSPGLDVWEVGPDGAGGLASTQRISAFPGESIQGIAMWKDGSTYYLAVRTLTQAQIYDITTCAATSCSSLAGREVGPPLALGNTGGWQTITFSRAGNPTTGRPFLYFGNGTMCHSGLRKEWLFDVSNPAAPVDVVGTKTMQVTGDDGVPVTVDYWSHYYANNPSGFSQVMPREGQFSGNHFYRAARTIMEAHELVNVDPAISMTGPDTVYQGTAASFTASAANCTPSPTWTWSAGTGATITGSGATVQIAWSELGQRTVVASNSACGSAQAQKTVQVNDPAPVIGTVTASPTTAFVCQPITFTATGVGGKPPLTRAWRVEPAAGGTPTPLGSTTDIAVWTSPSSTAAGQYKGFLNLSGTGAPAEKSATVTLNALPTLPAAGVFAPVADPAAPEFGTLTLSVAAPGATEWNWDYGTGYTGWTNDPVTGPSHSHTYTQADIDAACGGTVPCVFDVKVKIRNCVEGERESAALPVTITQINPLEITTFQGRGCFAFGCNYDLNEPATFDLVVTGDPTGYQFDWDGNGTFEDTTSTPVNGTVIHTFTSVGTFFPRVKVLRGSEEKVKEHPKQVQISGSTVPKSISISGPGSGTVGASLTFTATASGCTPSSSGWTWNKGGGSGSSTSNQITLSWASSGTKNISATNSGCSGATGIRSVSITSTNPDPDPDSNPRASLVPKFSFTPGTPQVGQKVTFDGSASEGSPTSYVWKIEGKTYTTATAQHTFTANGNHQVVLEISKPNPLCVLGVCSQSTTKTVTVSGAAPDPNPTGGNGCTGDKADDEDKLCLGSGRYEIEVDFHDQYNDKSGRGQAVKFAGSERTGFFWFFRPTNFELVVKILDGTPVNGRIWVFYGATTDVGYTIEVTDTVTGAEKTYESLPGTFCGRADTGAFPADAAASAALAGAPAGAARVTAATHQGGSDPAETLRLLDRFEVTVDFSTQDEQGQTVPGKGKAVAGTGQSGYFWFFREDNIELLIKMVDATAIGDYFWAFVGALSDVGYTVHVHDPVTEQDWEFVNPQGSYCGGYDGQAFFVGD